MFFEDQTVRDRALDSLRNLKQGTRSASEFSLEFTLLADNANVDLTTHNDFLISILQENMDHKITREIFRTQGRPPRNVSDYLDRAIKVKNIETKLKGIAKGNAPNPFQCKAAPTTTSFVANTDPRETMQEKVGTAPAGTSGWAMSMDQARRQGLCCHCQQEWKVGHSCNQKKIAQGVWQQRTGQSGQRREVQAETPKTEQGVFAMMQEMMKKQDEALESMHQQIVALKCSAK